VIVGASKPAFFMEGTTLREVDVTTGTLKISHVAQRFVKGRVYQGGNLDIFEKLAGIQVLPLYNEKKHIQEQKQKRVLYRPIQYICKHLIYEDLIVFFTIRTAILFSTLEITSLPISFFRKRNTVNADSQFLIIV
jgi:5'-nucleotidase